ncbi:hypothetical protein [Fervidibacillus halotolerans]|uniref:Uncharacterized protein n=1 Tax=Fervidibacillus halotolerans TaxID=2980027 RepID=A0A9E8RZA2_9BACI|nr:hypothetical protein [Fervidibacillus halotolerans]WAA11462.1 hypothetical protein OE105_07395 [Fervidibacillus halotolerans]
MKRETLILFFITGLIFFSYLYWEKEKMEETKESITYFPPDPNASFFQTSTDLQYEGRKKKWFEITLRSFSNFDQRAYLRQDVTFLFANGRLIGKVSNWKRDVRELEMKKTFPFNEDALFQAITFHHSEIHESNEKITSVQALSEDELYVVKTGASTIHFHEPKTKEEALWKEMLDQKSEETLKNSKQFATQTGHIQPILYDPIPLTKLATYSNEPFPHYSMEETRRIIGQLMEGLYKNYFFGMKNQEGAIIPPLGSSIPIIWIPKNKNHLFITIETSDGQMIILQQNIQS